MSDLNVGVVGLGWVAGAHIETFKSVQGAGVTAVCSRRELKESELQAQYGIPLKAYRSLDAMLADPNIHIIDICTPHPLHAGEAIAAAKAGKHLIIEKPLCLTYSDSLKIRDAIRQAKVNACVCFEARFSQHFSLIHSVVTEGLLGDLHYGEVDYFHGIGPWYKQYEWNMKKDFGGSSLLTAARNTRSDFRYTGRLTCLRRTATWWRRTATSSSTPALARSFDWTRPSTRRRRR